MNRVVNRNSAQSVSNCTLHAVYFIFFVWGEGGSLLDFFRSQCVPIKFPMSSQQAPHNTLPALPHFMPNVVLLKPILGGQTIVIYMVVWSQYLYIGERVSKVSELFCDGPIKESTHCHKQKEI
jgi:hypothetical protein